VANTVDVEVFVSVVVVVFQSVFCLEIYQNNIFFIKIIYDISILKQFKNIKKLI